MTTWADAHRRAAAMAAEIHSDLRIPLDRPVDVFDAVERMGIVLAFAPLGRASGLYLPNQENPGILLNEGHPRTRQRYTAGHELGHHAFHHAGEVDFDLEVALLRGDVERWPDREKEAEAFGAWFLMPRRLMRRGLESIKVQTPTNPYDVYALSLWLGTSFTATARQLGATRLAPYQLAESWARIPPRTLKLALAGELAPDDLRNDVFWLNEKQGSNPGVDARPGDRLVVMLDEIPSTGYSWEVSHLPPGLHLLADSFEVAWEPLLAQEGSDGAGDLDGKSHPRCLVFEVDRDLAPSEQRLSLIKERAWVPGEIASEFGLVVRVNAPLHGVQLEERELALTG